MSIAWQFCIQEALPPHQPSKVSLANPALPMGRPALLRDRESNSFAHCKCYLPMNAITALGKWLYALPMLVFGVFHFMNANQMAGMVPIPGGSIWVYVTGLAFLAAGISILLGRLDKLAAILLALMLLIFALSIHLPSVLGGNQSSMSSLLKDIALAGGALMYARGLARDAAVTD